MNYLVRNSAVVGKHLVVTAVLLFGVSVALAQNSKSKPNALKSAIEKAQGYLLSEETEVDVQSLFLYQYVQRKFGLDPISDEELRDKISPDHMFYPFLRLVKGVNPVVDTTVFAKAGSAIDRATLKSIYCDKFPVDESFLDTLLLASQKGKYTLTHALWSLQLMQENGCLKSMKRGKEVSDKIARMVAEMVSQSSFKDDIAIEGICFLYGMKRMDLIDQAWVNIMVGHQASDGGFFRTPKNSITNSKTTVLALWCMLEFQSNGSKTEPWIH